MTAVKSSEKRGETDFDQLCHSGTVYLLVSSIPTSLLLASHPTVTSLSSFYLLLLQNLSQLALYFFFEKTLFFSFFFEKTLLLEDNFFYNIVLASV